MYLWSSKINSRPILLTESQTDPEKANARFKADPCAKAQGIIASINFRGFILVPGEIAK